MKQNSDKHFCSIQWEVDESHPNKTIPGYGRLQHKAIEKGEVGCATEGDEDGSDETGCQRIAPGRAAPRNPGSKRGGKNKGKHVTESGLQYIRRSTARDEEREAAKAEKYVTGHRCEGVLGRKQKRDQQDHKSLQRKANRRKWQRKSDSGAYGQQGDA